LALKERYFGTSESDYPLAEGHIPEEWNSQLPDCESLEDSQSSGYSTRDFILHVKDYVG